MGDYLVKETLTPNEGAYPRFTRSTGVNTDFPLKSSCQQDKNMGGVNCIEPDKGGVAGFALVKLYDATQDKRYLAQAIQNADVLVKNMRPGDAMHAPGRFAWTASPASIGGNAMAIWCSYCACSTN